MKYGWIERGFIEGVSERERERGERERGKREREGREREEKTNFAEKIHFYTNFVAEFDPKKTFFSVENFQKCFFHQLVQIPKIAGVVFFFWRNQVEAKKKKECCFLLSFLPSISFFLRNMFE
jgi:hypothetical protein